MNDDRWHWKDYRWQEHGDIVFSCMVARFEASGQKPIEYDTPLAISTKRLSKINWRLS